MKFSRSKFSSSARGRVTSFLSIMFVASLLSGLASSRATAAEPGTPASKQQAPASTEELRSREAWHATMSQTPMPKKGCFTATYPNTKWQEVPCGATPPYPQPPPRGPRPDIVGNTNDVGAQAPSGFISTAIGSFDSVSGVTSESGPIGNAGPPVANAYTLQLNTDQFVSTVCASSPNPACKGWQQFVFENNGSLGRVYIQYWLIKYNTTCPAGGGWNQFSFTGSTDIYCWKNDSMGATYLPAAQPITNLGQLILTGTVSAGGDGATIFDGSNLKGVTGDNAVNAAAGWQIAGFNVYGDGGNSAGGGQASFTGSPTIVTRTRVIYGGTAPLNCVAHAFTAETNNLNFGPKAPAASQPGPALEFTESSAGGLSGCAAATTVGDTHLTTLGGLLYDFQASGDFVLAQVDPDFVVQTRQASGAPTWPNAAVNKAVATRMGKTRVAICLAPVRLAIDGKISVLDDRQSLSLPDGVDVKRKGNAYFITGESGDSVRADVNPTWINVSVGLGHWPAKVRGILANANGNVNEIATLDGTVLTNPFSFADLYHRYADSWRVPSDESLLRVCGDREIENGIPTKTFYANDLDPKVYERTRAVCTAAGVKVGPLLDACTLDVAVIGSDTAAQVFVGAPAPIAVGNVTTSDNSWTWLWWVLALVIVVVIAFMLWIFLIRKAP